MNGTYEIEYHNHNWQWDCERETVTVDGRSARNNRTPICLIEHARKTAQQLGAWRFCISAISLRHITASTISATTAKLIYEEELHANSVPSHT